MSPPNVTRPDDPSAPRDRGPRPLRRVALVVARMWGGGKERIVVHLATEFASRGIEPTVVCLDSKGEFGERLEAAGMSVVALGSCRGWDPAAVWRLAGVFRQARPDVINVHDRSSLPYAFLANRLGGRHPIVFSCHGLLFQEGSRPRWLERLAMRDVRAVTAVSDVAAREYAKVLDWSGPVEVVPNGVPAVIRQTQLRNRLRAELGLKEDVFAFLAVGNINPEKGYEDLLEATWLLRQRESSPLVVLVAGARSNEAYWRTLADRLAELGLEDTVRFLGFRADMEGLYSVADAFVLPSRKEGLPMVLLEAMSAGLPVIATAVGGVPSVVTDGHNGLLASARAPASLAETMAKVRSSRGLREQLGIQARKHLESHYSVADMATRYARVYALASASCGLGVEGGSRVTWP